MEKPVFEVIQTAEGYGVKGSYAGRPVSYAANDLSLDKAQVENFVQYLRANRVNIGGRNLINAWDAYRAEYPEGFPEALYVE